MAIDRIAAMPPPKCRKCRLEMAVIVVVRALRSGKPPVRR
jgi:hypothetical protein